MPIASTNSPFGGGTPNFSAVNSAVPDAGALSDKAKEIISRMLDGVPSPSQSRRDAAFFGAEGGIPGSEFTTRYGYDLYNKRADAMKQQGYQDLLAFLESGRGDRQLDLSSRQLDQSSADAASRLALEQQRLKQQQDQFNAELGLKKRQIASSQPKNSGIRASGQWPGSVPGFSSANRNPMTYFG